MADTAQDGARDARTARRFCSRRAQGHQLYVGAEAGLSNTDAPGTRDVCIVRRRRGRVSHVIECVCARVGMRHAGRAGACDARAIC